MNLLMNKLDIKRDEIVNDIRRNIADGGLKAGDKLASTRQLVDHYGVSQWVVFDAMKELEKNNLVERKHRSGCYIREALEQIDAAATPSALKESSTNERFNPDYFLAPKKKVRELSFYVSDGYPSSLKLFREVIAGFMSRHPDIRINMLSYQGGHIQDLISEGKIDVVQTSLSIIKDIEQDKFIPIGDLERLGINEEEMLPPVRKHFRSDKNPRFVPFSLTLQYLYVNCDLLARSKTLKIPESTKEMFAVASEFEKKYSGDGEYGMIYGNLMHLFNLYGVSSLSKDGKMKLDKAKAKRILSMIGDSHLRCINYSDKRLEIMPESMDNLFSEGKILCQGRYSFFTQLLEEKNMSGWKAAVLPSSPDSAFESHLSAMTVMKDTKYPEESLKLIEYLAGKEIQKKFAALHGNLSIYSEFYDSEEKLKGHPVPYDVIRDTLEKSDRNWMAVNADNQIKDAVNDFGYRFYTGQASVEETLGKVLKF